jgi:polyisoprenoid-binding protein YceI
MFTKFVISGLFLTALLPLSFRERTIRPQRSAVTFKIKNFGMTVEGSFSGLKGSVRFDPDKPGEVSFDVTVDAKTVNTGNSARDRHLQAPDYFHAAKYPAIRFKSTSVTRSGNTWVAAGKLTIRDVTKDVILPFSFSEVSNTFSGKLALNRRDYHVGGKSISMSDDVEVEIKVLAD